MKLRFSIRDLLWLTALLAVLVAWWIDRNDIMARQSRYFFVKFTKGEDVMYDTQTGTAWIRDGNNWVQATKD